MSEACCPLTACPPPTCPTDCLTGVGENQGVDGGGGGDGSFWSLGYRWGYSRAWWWVSAPLHWATDRTNGLHGARTTVKSVWIASGSSGCSTGILVIGSYRRFSQNFWPQRYRREGKFGSECEVLGARAVPSHVHRNIHIWSLTSAPWIPFAIRNAVKN